MMIFAQPEQPREQQKNVQSTAPFVWRGREGGDNRRKVELVPVAE